MRLTRSMKSKRSSRRSSPSLPPLSPLSLSLFPPSSLPPPSHPPTPPFLSVQVLSLCIYSQTSVIQEEILEAWDEYKKKDSKEQPSLIVAGPGGQQVKVEILTACFGRVDCIIIILDTLMCRMIHVHTNTSIDTALARWFSHSLSLARRRSVSAVSHSHTHSLCIYIPVRQVVIASVQGQKLLFQHQIGLLRLWRPYTHDTGKIRCFMNKIVFSFSLYSCPVIYIYICIYICICICVCMYIYNIIYMYNVIYV